VRSSKNCTHKEDLGKKLCSACTKPTYPDGSKNDCGEWHGQFDRTFLPMDMFETNQVGNLAHKETGDDDYMKFEIKKEG
jgi:hypothetical protein